MEPKTNTSHAFHYLFGDMRAITDYEKGIDPEWELAFKEGHYEIDATCLLNVLSSQVEKVKTFMMQLGLNQILESEGVIVGFGQRLTSGRNHSFSMNHSHYSLEGCIHFASNEMGFPYMIGGATVRVDNVGELYSHDKIDIAHFLKDFEQLLKDSKEDNLKKIKDNVSLSESEKNTCRDAYATHLSCYDPEMCDGENFKRWLKELNLPITVEKKDVKGKAYKLPKFKLFKKDKAALSSSQVEKIESMQTCFFAYSAPFFQQGFNGYNSSSMILKSLQPVEIETDEYGHVLTKKEIKSRFEVFKPYHSSVI